MPGKNEQPLAHLGFQRLAPSSHLAEYVDCYWAIKRTEPLLFSQPDFMYPDGGSGVIYNFGSPALLDRKLMASPFALDGVNTKAISAHFPGVVDALGIRFKPGGAAPFFRDPLHELKNQSESLEALEMKEFVHLGNSIPQCESFQKRATIIEATLSELLRKSTQIPPSHLLSVIRKQVKPHFSVATLSQCAGVGCRQLERLFKKHLGMTPGEYLKIQRVEMARRFLKSRADQKCTQIGLDSGYYDQSHFIKEFRSVTGMTPHFYRNRKRAHCQ